MVRLFGEKAEEVENPRQEGKNDCSSKTAKHQRKMIQRSSLMTKKRGMKVRTIRRRLDRTEDWMHLKIPSKVSPTRKATEDPESVFTTPLLRVTMIQMWKFGTLKSNKKTRKKTTGLMSWGIVTLTQMISNCMKLLRSHLRMKLNQSWNQLSRVQPQTQKWLSPPRMNRRLKIKKKFPSRLSPINYLRKTLSKILNKIIQLMFMHSLKII